MTDEQFNSLLDLLKQTLKETREGFAQLNKDRDYEFQHFDNQLKEIYLVVGQSRHEAHVLTDTADQAVKKVEKANEEMVEKVDGLKSAIESVPVPEEDKNLPKGNFISKLLGRNKKKEEVI